MGAASSPNKKLVTHQPHPAWPACVDWNPRQAFWGDLKEFVEGREVTVVASVSVAVALVVAIMIHQLD